MIYGDFPTSLTEINLHSNQITDVGFSYIISSMSKHWFNPTKLICSDNRITSKSVIELAKLITDNHIEYKEDYEV